MSVLEMKRMICWSFWTWHVFLLRNQNKIWCELLLRWCGLHLNLWLALLFSDEALLIQTSLVETISLWWVLDFVMLYKCRVHLGFISSELRSLCPGWWVGSSWEGWLRAWGICPIAGRPLPLVPTQAGASFMVPWEHSWREWVHF